MYCGLVDSKGLESLAEKTPELSVLLYKKATDATKDGLLSCYFEVSLDSNQVDIFKDLNKTQESKSAHKALLQFGGKEITVPDVSSDAWTDLTKKLKKK